MFAKKWDVNRKDANESYSRLRGVEMARQRALVLAGRCAKARSGSEYQTIDVEDVHKRLGYSALVHRMHDLASNSDGYRDIERIKTPTGTTSKS
jgi:hypothetical protein